jgi:hypothetical protein
MTDDQVPDTERPLPGPLVTALCVTHERPEWMPWVTTQVIKQVNIAGLTEMVMIDSSAKPRNLSWRLWQVDKPSIAAKRNIALGQVTTPYFAWFDDDDWSHPERLKRGVRILEACPELVAVGPVFAYKIDAATLRSDFYKTKEHIVFNGAVYRTEHWKRFEFNERLAVAEDTDWQMRGIRGESYGVVNKILCAWLCHGSNIANRADRVLFNDKFPAQLSEFRAELESNPRYQG